ncbi:MAG: PEP-CTERM sorting domain-containing protein [Phycisphaera sp.]|nr:PEP-CTERM sorting domain-containing protein [Phycisphaera sp.]
MTHYRTLAAVITGTALIAGVTTAANAGVITVSTSAPTVDGADVANLVSPSGSTLIYGDRPVQGQTFTTSAAAAQQLVSLTVMISEGTGLVFDGWKDYRIRFGTPDSPLTTLAPTINEVVRYNPDLDVSTQYYFTFTFDTPIALAASTVYMFDVGVNGSQEGWGNGIPSIYQSGNTYAGGTRTQGAKTTLAASDYGVSGASGNDLIFHADIAIIPEPASVALLALGSTMLLPRRRK